MRWYYFLCGKVRLLKYNVLHGETMKKFFRKIFRSKTDKEESSKPKKMQDSRMENRLQREIEGLYGNEALTRDLDDDGAKVFLKWAEDRVRTIVQSTEDLDDTTAEEQMYPRLKAIRRMARYVNQAIAKQAANPDLIEKILEQAKVLYGGTFAEPDRQKLQAMLMRGTNPAEFIQALKNFLEGDMDGKEEDNQQQF